MASRLSPPPLRPTARRWPEPSAKPDRLTARRRPPMGRLAAVLAALTLLGGGVGATLLSLTGAAPSGGTMAAATLVIQSDVVSAELGELVAGRPVSAASTVELDRDGRLTTSPVRLGTRASQSAGSRTR